MAEAFRNLLNPQLVKAAASHLRRVWPEFAEQDFAERVLHDFEALPMKARAMRIADVLEHSLPMDFAAAAALIEASLRPVRGDEALGEMRSNEDGLAGWIVWSLGEFVARRGIDQPQRALQCLHALTQRFSAEFAIRPLLIRHPQQVYSILHGWLDDPSPHVRRLISEGTRPRLPWGMALPAAVADPSPAYPLLHVLQDDSSAYVRRSVANHLNDIAREHPQRLVDWLLRYLPGASAQRKAVLKHASRTLIKRGNAQVLQAWGLGRRYAGSAHLQISPAAISVGQDVLLELDLRSASAHAQTLVIDYLVHHVRANGQTAPKVFKGWTLELAASSSRQLSKRHRMHPISTRRYYPGLHRVEIQINGRSVAGAAFALESE